ncbi:GH92 family glycosyl hydrolase [Gordoniibacillus kamchatkensis]|uniref:GH92 family glycosyl hydrolase n=1 Tax=Gordoniibacillus kamchatkensis TaxID=1590651 RepID=UPI0006978609|nr:GH92 family glycosyl hydrolase [Paenibacillus sp. VKM B-2647]
MRKSLLTKSMAMVSCSAMLAGLWGAPVAGTAWADAAPAPTNFFTSFEAGDAQPTWVNTTETDSSGNKMASGVDGNTPYPGIPGNISSKVVQITARGENPPNEIATNLTDSNNNTKWLDFNKTSWAQFKFDVPRAVVKYALTSANDAPGRDPKNWTLQGSNDGSNWTVLDTRTNQSFSGRFVTNVYDFQNATAYLYYKLDITLNNGDNIIQLAEVQLSDGIELPPPPPAEMKSNISNGPTSLYTAKNGAGWSGLKAMTFSGTNLVNGRAYSYNKIYDVNIDVTPNTELSYYLAPQFTSTTETDYTSTYSAVDLAFSDGTYLHDLGARDQHGFKLDPAAQGNSKALYNNQWNFIKSKIGDVAAGKTIKRILLAYDNPSAAAGTSFKTTVDDIKIDGNPAPRAYSRLSDYADILRGTQSNGAFSRGNNVPAVAVPHGFNFWTPMTDAGSSSWIYTYNEKNTANNLPAIQAFALNHEPSPWMGDRQTFQVMPSNTAGVPSANRTDRQLEFKHANEIAKPYYYGVTFENGMKTEFVPTDHAAMFRFTFTGNESNLIFDNQSNSGGITLNADGSIQGYSDQKSGNSNGATRMFFYATFDKPATAGGNPSKNGGGSNVSRYYKFDTTADKTVTMKIATSLIGVDQAKKNLDLEISPADTFETIKEKAQTKWDQVLGTIQVEGATEDQLVTLYSNMYRLFLWPNSAFENAGTIEAPVYKHADQTPLTTCSTSTAVQTCAKIVDGKSYVNNGFWDTYRTTWPAYSLLTPAMAGELIDGFVQQYKDGGWISRWSSPGYANIMVGTSADVAFADAYLKGVTNFDVKSFYQAAIKDASVNPPNANVGRKGMNTSVFNGYTSYNGLGEAMSWAMDGYINDFGIANLAKALADKNDSTDPYNANYRNDYQYYINRAQNYVNMFNPNIGFFNGKDSNGAWRNSPGNFNPLDWGGGSGDYTETNAWNMAFHAPQDGQGLANLYGGKEKLAQKLDQFFSTPETAQHPGTYGGLIHEMREARDVRMGNYGHSNQPSHHIIYMYDYAGKPSKTQALVREALTRLYVGSEIGQGYSGDEDNGEMSAWYVFSSLGFYPLQMGSPEYAIGAPLFKKATINLENGKKIVINAPNNSMDNKYVQSLKVNGIGYSKTYISHADLAGGAVLDFDMGPNPSTWGSGSSDAPISITQGTDVPRPYRDRTDKLIAQGAGKVTDSEGTAAATLNSLFDNNSGTTATINSAAPWIQYEFTKGREKVSMYTLTSSSGSSNADPKSWVVKGSNDGKSWTMLDTRSNETFPWRQQTRAFAINSDAEYSMYRLEITANGGGTSTSLAEVEFLGSDISDQDSVAKAIAALDLGNTNNVTVAVALPSAGVAGTTIAWSSSDTTVLSNAGKVVARPRAGDPDKAVTLTATVAKGAVSQSKTFTVIVKALTKFEPPYAAGTDFASGFEPGDLAPDWSNSRIASKNVTEFCCSIGGMESKPGVVDYDKTNALLYSGNAADPSENYSYNQLFNVAFDIKPSTVLSYKIFPEGPNALSSTSTIRKTSAYIAVDLLFTDGTYLHDLNALDQNSIRLNPLAQGQGGKIQLDAWNTVSAQIGKVAAGKIVDKILISFNATGQSGYFRGYVDDINIRHDESLPDTNPPVTTASVTPAAPDGTNGWYVHPVTVSLQAADNESGVAATEYSLDGGTTWQSYTGAVTVSQDGKYTLSYRSTDNTGNVEAAKTVSFNLDATAPTITVTGVVYGTLSDAGDMTPIVTVNDNLSGVDSGKTTVTLDVYGLQQGTTIPLYTLPLGSHTLVVTSSDQAGNVGSKTVIFQTTASIESLKALVTRFAGAGWIDNAGIARSLQAKLAANNVADFVNEVKAQSGKHISSQAANYLLRDAQYLLAQH